MRLSDIMGNMQLENYAEIGLVIFLVVFAAVVVRVFSKKHAADYEAARHMPLDDELIRTPIDEEHTPTGAS